MYRGATLRLLILHKPLTLTHVDLTMSADFRHILALTAISGIGPAIIRQLLTTFGRVDDIVHATPADLPTPNTALANALKNIPANLPDALQYADSQIDTARRYGIKTISITDADYPRRLAAIPDAPLTLFVKGDVNFETAKTLAVVGTRKPSDEGRTLCQGLISDLCRRHPDIIIVSGLAFGVDVTAHRAALSTGRPTVAVVAHGLNTIYPAQHRDVAAKISHAGAVVSEFPFGTQPEAYNFVSRNRIIAGLADATLIVESAVKGGSLITTRYAFDYDRQVLAVPGFPGRELSAGCNDLIKRNVATLVESADDVDAALSWDVPMVVRRAQEAQQATPSLFAQPQGPEQVAIVNALRSEDGLTASGICQRTHLNIQSVNVALLNLEFAGIVKSLAGNSYRLLI